MIIEKVEKVSLSSAEDVAITTVDAMLRALARDLESSVARDEALEIANKLTAFFDGLS